MEKLSDEDFLKLLLNDFNSNLASKELAASLISSFQIDALVLEKNLNNSSKIDISFPLYRKDNEFLMFFEKQKFYKNSNPKWMKILSLIEDIIFQSKYNFIDELWLEFDEDGYKKLNSNIPGFYFNVNNFNFKKINLITELIFRLRNRSASIDVTNKIEKVLMLAESNCEYMGIGVFSERKNEPIRIGWLLPIVKAIELSKHYKIGNKIIDFLKTQKKFIDENVIVHFNISEEDVYLQGIELYTRSQRQWEPVYDSLAKYLFCHPNIKSQILKWSDTYFENVQVTESSKIEKLSSNYHDFFYCGINHFKLINNENLDLKVYHNVNFISKIGKAL